MDVCVSGCFVWIYGVDYCICMSVKNEGFNENNFVYFITWYYAKCKKDASANYLREGGILDAEEDGNGGIFEDAKVPYLCLGGGNRAMSAAFSSSFKMMYFSRALISSAN